MLDLELMAQGAEARLYKGIYLGKSSLVKERFVKNYRHPELDARLTKDRIRAEARAIIRARSAGIATPALYLVDLERRSIYMEYVENATTLKDFIDKNVSGKPNMDRLLDLIGRGLGRLVAKLHSKHIIHGDLTTSNILLKTDSKIESLCSGDSEGKGVSRQGNNNPDREDCDKFEYVEAQFVMIDFGLARVDSTLEDKAVDLYVLERSLLSAHSELPTLFSIIFDYYQRYYQNKNQCEQVLSKYRQVQARGRKRLMIG